MTDRANRGSPRVAGQQWREPRLVTDKKVSRRGVPFGGQVEPGDHDLGGTVAAHRVNGEGVKAAHSHRH